MGAEIAELDTVHRAQAIIKRTNKIGLKEACVSDEDVQNVVECLVSLPLLPPEEIVAAIDDVEVHVLVDSSHENQLRQLIRYVKRQWINKHSDIGRWTYNIIIM